MPSRRIQSHCPESSTLGRVPRGNHAACGSTCTDFVVWLMQTTMASIFVRFLSSSWSPSWSYSSLSMAVQRAFDISIQLYSTTAGNSDRSTRCRRFPRESPGRAPACRSRPLQEARERLVRTLLTMILRAFISSRIYDYY